MYISIVKTSKIEKLQAKIDKLASENASLKVDMFEMNEQNKHLEIENNRLKLENAELTELAKTSSQRTLSTWTSSEKNFRGDVQKIQKKKMSTFMKVTPEAQKKRRVGPKVPLRISSLPQPQNAPSPAPRKIDEPTTSNPRFLSISRLSMRSAESQNGLRTSVRSFMSSEEDKENVMVFELGCGVQNLNHQNLTQNQNQIQKQLEEGAKSS